MTLTRYENKNGKVGWMIDVSRQIEGRLIRKRRVVFGSHAEAAKFEDRLNASLYDEFYAPKRDTEPTLGAIADAYLEHSELTNRQPKTNGFRFIPLLEFFGRGRRARSIVPDDIHRYRAWRAKQKTRQGRAVSPATIDREQSALKAAFNHACMNRLLDPPYNPVQYVKLLKAYNHRERELSSQELNALLLAAPPLLRGLIFAAAYLGLRKSHLLALQWEQVVDGLIFPPDAKEKQSLIESSKRHGIVPLPKSLEQFLENEERMRWTKGKRNGLVFTRNGQPVKDFKTSLDELKKKTGLDFWFHDLRRTYASFLRRLGADVETRLVIMGHAPDPRMQTHSRYQVVSEEDLRKVGALIEADKQFQRHLRHCQLLGSASIRFTLRT